MATRRNSSRRCLLAFSPRPIQPKPNVGWNCSEDTELTTTLGDLLSCGIGDLFGLFIRLLPDFVSVIVVDLRYLSLKLCQQFGRLSGPSSSA
jgi:hypothetical protein